MINKQIVKTEPNPTDTHMYFPLLETKLNVELSLKNYDWSRS